MKNHYNMLDEYFQKFAENMSINYPVGGLISAHGDKFYYYRELFESNGLEFWQGVAIGLLSYVNPWAKEVRDTKNGFIKFEDWFAANKDKFVSAFPEKVQYEMNWTAPDGFFGSETFECYKDAETASWDYKRESCQVSIFRGEEEIISED